MKPIYEFHVARRARDKYQFDETLFATDGRVVLADFGAARRFTERIYAVSGRLIPASDIYALGLMDEILHLIIRQYEKQNPGGESIYVSVGKASAGTPVKLASKVDAVAAKKTVSDRKPLLTDVANRVASNQVASDGTIADAGARNTDSLSGESAFAPPSLPAEATNSLPLRGVLSAIASVPSPSAPVSAGITGGQAIHRVAPVYPPQALQARKEATVVLAATVMEDGSVHDIRVVEGPEVFANSAVEALKQWRYQPFQLDGKAVKNEIRIKVDFNFPSGIKH